jgi:hypothetical protein
MITGTNSIPSRFLLLIERKCRTYILILIFCENAYIPIGVYCELSNEGKLMGTDRFSIPMLLCHRCGHKWFLRQARLPQVCPNCKSPYWKTGSEFKMELDQDEQKAREIEKNFATKIDDMGNDPKECSEIIEIGWQRILNTSDFPIKNLQTIFNEGFSVDEWFINVPSISTKLVFDVVHSIQEIGTSKVETLSEIQKKIVNTLEWEKVIEKLSPDIIKILAILWYADSFACQMRYPEAETILQKRAWLIVEKKLGITAREATSTIEQAVSQLDETSQGATSWAEVIRVP